MRVLGILLSIVIYVFSIDVHVTKDKKITIENSDIMALQQYFQKILNFHITEEGAKNLVRDNRILANKYIESPYFSKDKKYNQIIIEKIFADNYIQHIQSSIRLPQKILKSYYLDHIEQYKKSDKIFLELFHFSNYQQALNFYQNPLQDRNNIGKGKTIGWVSIKNINSILKSLLKKGQENYFLPPIVTKDGIDVFWVKKYKKESGYQGFDTVKSQIKEYLLKKTFVKKREEILRKITGNE